MNSTLTFSVKAVSINASAIKPMSFSSFGRTLARKWDMLAIISLMVSSAVYSVYAVTQMTGF